MSDYLNGTQSETENSSYRMVSYDEVVKQLVKLSRESEEEVEQHLQKQKLMEQVLVMRK